MPFVSKQQQKWGNSKAGIKALGGKARVAEWNASTKGHTLPRKVKKTKRGAVVSVDNKLKGSYGQTIIQKGEKPIIKINVKKHKGDKAELADTIKHELMHAKHPKMLEKTVYKKMKKTISSSEQASLLAKLRTKGLNYKIGAIKRKLKITRHEKIEPGDMISRARSISRPERVAIMGAV